MPKVPMPEFPLGHNFPDTVKGWAACEKNREDWYAFWKYLAGLRFHTPQEDKGIPVEGTGKHRYHSRKDSGKTGVIGNSHVVSHRYMDEGDKGPSHRREIKRRESVMVNAEIAEGINEWEETMCDTFSYCIMCENPVSLEQGEYITSDDTPCPLSVGHITDTDAYRSEKFGNDPAAEFFWQMDMQSMSNDSLGDAETFGYFAKFTAYNAILDIDSQGFVRVHLYDDAEVLDSIWDDLASDWYFYNDDAEGYCCVLCDAN